MKTLIITGVLTAALLFCCRPVHCVGSDHGTVTHINKTAEFTTIELDDGSMLTTDDVRNDCQPGQAVTIYRLDNGKVKISPIND